MDWDMNVILPLDPLYFYGWYEGLKCFFQFLNGSKGGQLSFILKATPIWNLLFQRAYHSKRAYDHKVSDHILKTA